MFEIAQFIYCHDKAVIGYNYVPIDKIHLKADSRGSTQTGQKRIFVTEAAAAVSKQEMNNSHTNLLARSAELC